MVKILELNKLTNPESGEEQKAAWDKIQPPTHTASDPALWWGLT